MHVSPNSAPENISLSSRWKKKSEVDYIPLFVSLWLSLNAWMRDKYAEDKDRELIELCKTDENDLKDKFSGLLSENNAEGNRFKGNLAELQRALLNAHISYRKCNGQYIEFANSIIEWNDGEPNFESILKESGQQDKIEIDKDIHVENDPERVFAAYLEIAYQIRCLLFHGNLSPEPKNERVIKQLYLTLSMVMEGV